MLWDCVQFKVGWEYYYNTCQIINLLSLFFVYILLLQDKYEQGRSNKEHEGGDVDHILKRYIFFSIFFNNM